LVKILIKENKDLLNFKLMDCQIIKFIKEKGEIIGVLLQIGNGETEYLTIKEYNTWSKQM